MNGDRPISHVENQFKGAIKRRVPGLREEVPPSPCKVYKIQPDGSLKLDRIE